VEVGDYMLNVLRVIVVVIGGISLIITAMDNYSFFGFKIENETIKTVVYLVFGICALFFSIDDFLIWLKSR